MMMAAMMPEKSAISPHVTAFLVLVIPTLPKYTTFYILAVYFGSVGIVRTRHAVPCGLLADAAGVIAAILICYLFFG